MLVPTQVTFTRLVPVSPLPEAGSVGCEWHTPATARELPSAAGRGLDGRCLGSYASTIPRVAWSQRLTDLRAQRLSPCALRWGPCSRGAAPALALPVRPGSGQVSAETTSLLGFSFICIPYFPLGSPEGIRSITHAGKNPCQAVLSGTSPKAQERRVWVSRNWGSWIHFHWWAYFMNTGFHFQSTFVYFAPSYSVVSILYSLLSLKEISQREINWGAVKYPLSSNFWALKCFSAGESRGRSQDMRPGPEEVIINKALCLGVEHSAFSWPLSFHYSHRCRHLSSSERHLSGSARLQPLKKPLKSHSWVLYHPLHGICGQIPR